MRAVLTTTKPSAAHRAIAIDWPLLILTLLIALIGVVNLYSATAPLLLVPQKQGLTDLYVKQITWLVAGGVAAAAVIAIDYRHFERLAYFIYGGGLLLLLLVFVLGRDIHGASRWIEIGGKGGFDLQPSEYMKLVLAIALAKYLHDDPKPTAAGGRSLRDLIIPTLLAAIPFFLVAKQPDLGTALILAGIFVTLMSLSKIRIQSLISLTLTLAIGAPIVWIYLLRDFQKQRLLSFINPEADIRGTNWHAHHARIAIGNGGLWGCGFLRGTQNHYLYIPEQHSDFPFPVFAEEWGLVGSIVLLMLYLFLVLWGIRIASNARDRFGAALATGLSAMIFFHVFFNVGMVTGVLPVVGVPLPLFSYGGSSVTSILIAIGLLMNISIRAGNR